MPSNPTTRSSPQLRLYRLWSLADDVTLFLEAISFRVVQNTLIPEQQTPQSVTVTRKMIRQEGGEDVFVWPHSSIDQCRNGINEVFSVLYQFIDLVLIELD